jgi:hypothetical protein
VWWYTPIIPALGRLRKEDCECEASLHYIVKPCLKNKNKTVKLSHSYDFMFLNMFVYFKVHIALKNEFMDGSEQNTSQKKSKHSSRFE